MPLQATEARKAADEDAAEAMECRVQLQEAQEEVSRPAGALPAYLALAHALSD